jgi:hypothetical protein
MGMSRSATSEEQWSVLSESRILDQGFSLHVLRTSFTRSHSKLTTSDTFVKLSFGGVAAKLVSKTSTQAIAAIEARGSLIIIIIVAGRCLIYRRVEFMYRRVKPLLLMDDGSGPHYFL